MKIEEILIIIRQHNSARIKPSRTELALIKAERKSIKNWLMRKVYADGLLIPHSIIDALEEVGQKPKRHYLDTVLCSKCKSEQPTEFAFCPNCGTGLRQAQLQATKDAIGGEG